MREYLSNRNFIDNSRVSCFIIQPEKDTQVLEMLRLLLKVIIISASAVINKFLSNKCSDICILRKICMHSNKIVSTSFFLSLTKIVFFLNRFYKSLNIIRWKHSITSRRSLDSNEGGILQKDMVLTQFGFIGYILIVPEVIALTNKKEEREAINHFWRVVGHLLGIPDRYVRITIYTSIMNMWMSFPFLLYFTLKYKLYL